MSDSDDEVNARLREGLRVSQMLVVLYDGQDRLRYANDAFREAFLSTTDSIDFSTIVRANHAAGKGVNIGGIGVETYISRACARRRSQRYCSYPIDLIGGKRLWLSEMLLPDGWLLCEAANVTLLKQAETSLRVARDVALEASQTDYLTKLPNRRYGFELLKRALTFAQAHAEPLCVAMIDLDFFKKINDQFGHDGGDMALCRFAQTCRGYLRSTDTIARIGGEEFLMILPGATMQAALALAQRLHHEPIRVHLDSFPVEFSYTFSAGVAQMSPGDSVQSLMARADQALYAAKARGRNTIQASEK
ncbi:MAG: GGDEF domain-containing protein [Burkholderiaceae bacterium]|nr:MAG: GGDEF domain-containing protein [Burkholderiaceae bacterium]TAM02200.1 MAG: GGDEF domain-containing protein [Pusillimonas sp.]